MGGNKGGADVAELCSTGSGKAAMATRLTAVAETAAKENILHLRLERADHDALEALVLSTGLDRGALARLVIRAGLRVAENDPRDLLAPKPTKG